MPTYITRRADRGGIFSIQIRITIFGGRRRLLRYSLATRDHRQAIVRASAYFRWLFQMVTPAEVDANIDRIIEIADGFVSEGRAPDDYSAQHRRHFLFTATRLLDSWHAESPCPIAFANLYRRQTQFAKALSNLSQRIREDFEILSIDAPDPHYAKRPQKVPFGYLCDKHGRVVEIVGLEMPAHYPTIAEELHLPGEGPLPLYDVGDLLDEKTSMTPADGHISSLSAAPIKFVASETPAEHASSPQVEDKSRGPLMSRLLDMFLDELAQEAGGSRSADRDVRPYIDLWVHILGDRPIAAYERDDVRLFCQRCSEVPHQSGMQAQTPIARLEHARLHGWDGLKRMSATTIQNRYFTAVRRMYRWAIEARHFVGVTPKLTIMGKQVNNALVKDAFNEMELERLFGAPMFTGHQAGNKAQPGPYLDQNAFYWGYLISILTGMRPGEIAQLEIADLKEVEGIYYFDARPCDPEQGRIALADMKSLKTQNAARMVPVHSVLIELGLLDRVKQLKSLGHARLFPEWKYRRLSDGDMKHGDALTRHWQKRKAFVTKRKNVSLYSGRHTMADLLDRLNVPQRDRDRILGHAHAGVAGRYGCKGPLPRALAISLVEADVPVVRFIRQRLVPARQTAEHDRKIVKPWAVKPSAADRS